MEAENDSRNFGCGSGTWGLGILHYDHTLSPARIYLILSVDSLNDYSKRMHTTGGGPVAVRENLPRFMVGF